MPIYCYRCNKCCCEFEETRKVDERYDVACPQCGAREDVEITPSTTSFILKGTGWTKDS